MGISGFNHQRQSFILLINVKLLTIIGILTLMSRINIMLSLVENEKRFYNLGQVSLSGTKYDDPFFYGWIATKYCLFDLLC